MQVPPHEPIARPLDRGAAGSLPLWARDRLQLLGALVVAVIVPALLRSQLSFLEVSLDSATATTIGSAAAVLAGAFVVRRITVYPGAQALAYVFPVFAGVFAAVVVIFFFARIDYSRAQFLLSFVLSVSWFLVALRTERRVRRLHFLVLPFGNGPSLVDMGGAEWNIARSPDDRSRGYSGVVADLRSDMPPDWQRMLADAALNGTPVYHSKLLAEALSGRVEIEHLSENHLGSLLPSRLYLRLKRYFDLALSIISLPIVLPAVALAVLAILLFDSGPVFFRQQRLGFRGKEFTVFKLRTMRPAPPRSDKGQHFTVENDTRVTTVGRFLRKFRIDELPQIVNILRGEMSWIGPRPEALALAEWYERKIPFYSYRHIVRPGISGWAAVNQGNVAKIDAATIKLQYDFYYIKHLSLWLDILIFGKTLRTVLTGFGAR
ncbi:MAG: sugar transferase [Alphaproteobacteria bacterium]